MLRLLLIAISMCVLGSAAYAQTGSAMSPAAMNSEINSTFASNTQITATQLRQVVLDMVASANTVIGSFSAATGAFAVDSSGNVTARTIATTSTSTASISQEFDANTVVLNDNNTTSNSQPTVALHVRDFQGANVNGGAPHVGILAESLMGGTQTTDNYYVGIWALARSTYNAGGSGFGGNSKGSIYGTNPSVQLTNGATFYRSVVGEEVDVEVDTGASTDARFGVNVVDYNGTQQGSSFDGALAIGSGGTPGWKNGILLTHFNVGTAPISSGGSVLSSDTAFTVAHGIDLSQLTCSSDCFKSNTFTVQGNGKISAQGYQSRSGSDSGSFGGNYFNFYWTGSELDSYVDVTNVGKVLLQPAGGTGFSVDVSGNLTHNTQKPALFTLSSLQSAFPCNSGNKGVTGLITDGSNSISWGATASAGGSTTLRVFCNGSVYQVD